MRTIPKGNMIVQGVDPAVLNDPELVRMRKEARRNITAEARQEMLTQVSERAMQEGYEEFKRESFEHLRKIREANERRKRGVERSVEPAAVEN